MVLVAIAMIVVVCGDGAASTTTAEPATTQSDETESSIPEEFPRPDDVEDFDVLIASEEDIHVQWETGMSTGETVMFFDQALVEQGWDILTQREGGDSTRYSISGHGWEGAISVLGGDPVKVVLQLGRPEDG